ncbi:leucine-rich repeat protein [Acetivibrio ethanolgignens]|uniref:BIG2 domain-containing protein n=1 Tax=Acetivibrio ethanolgignens TaxID=290052 RepID=A0A0V8QBX0_9FIRM|nr:leucine-rich repeat protein [Acetivibrio ethanolgignens]KSV57994.1 hypothetical protein ASU35_14395 [Acetivibrio ethanolgignens]
MKKRRGRKKGLALLLTTAMVMGLMPGTGVFGFGTAIVASAEVKDSGTFGEGNSFSWTLDDTGKLTISGSGAMDAWGKLTPWYELQDYIQSVEIKEGITTIGENAFQDCAFLKSITIPASVTTIRDGAFRGCRDLKTVSFGKNSGLKTIGESAFHSCWRLQSIVIPAEVTSIGRMAFWNCEKLKSINVLEENLNYCSVDGVLFNKAKTTLIAYPAYKSGDSYDIPDSVISIGEDAFSLCLGLESITIPNGVRTIGENAFQGCLRLKSITIPNDVRTIGENAFLECVNLTSIFYPGSFSGRIDHDKITTEITYTLDGDKVTITSITLGEGQTSVAIPDTTCGVPVAAVAADHQSKVGSHTHRLDSKDTCSICGKVQLKNISITITEPKATETLAEEARVSTTGVAADLITWQPSGTNAGYNKVYTASVTLSANEGYMFADSVAVTVNDLDVDSSHITKNADGKITVTYQFAKTDKGTLTASDFTFAAPDDLVYNGSAKAAAVTAAPSGVGEITVKYYDKSGKGLASAPVNAGTYIVKIDVAEGDEYNAISDVTASGWTFTISPRVITAADLEFVDAAITKVYDGMTDSNAKVWIKAGVVGTEAVEISGTSVYDSKDVTTASKVTFTPTAITSGNYTIAAAETIEHEAKITAKPVTGTNQTLLVKTNQAKDITYDLSKLLPAGVTGTTTYRVGEFFKKDGVLSSEPADADITDGKLTLHVAPVDSADKISRVTIFFVNDNYDISETSLTVQTTDKTPVTLSGVSCGNRAYNGTAYAYSGAPIWKTEDGTPVTGETTVTYYNYNVGDPVTPVDAPTNAGSYRAVFTIKSADYEGTENYSFEITKAQITVAAKNKSIYVGDAVPVLTNPTAGTDYTVTGLCGTDALGGAAAMSYGQEPDNTKTGAYEILISGLTAPAGDNYTITFTKGTLTITAKPSGGGSIGGDSAGGGSSSGGSSGGATDGTGDKTEGSGNITTITNKDGSTTTTKTETDAKGNTVTTTTRTDADGNVTGVTEKSVIAHIEKNTTATVTVKTDGDGNVTSAKASITKTSDSSKVSLSGKVLGQITEAAGADTKVRVTMTVKDNDGKTLYKVQADANEILPGEKLYIYKRDTKTGTYTMVNDKEYKVTKAGTVTVNMTKKATYELVTAKESKAIEKAILATVKPAKTSKSLSEGKKTTFKFSGKLDMDNVKSITYATSRKSIATVTKKGTITAVNAGTAAIRATVTLKNGTKKTIKMTIKVK